MSTQEKQMAKEEREFYELKQQASAFYAENGVPQKMEDVLNSMFYDSPGDVCGYLANYFESFAKDSTISKLQGKEVLDGRGSTAVQADVFCIVKNIEKLVTSGIASSESYPPDCVKPDELHTAEMERQTFVAKAVEYINGSMSQALAGTDPAKQDEVDATILEVLTVLQKNAIEESLKDKDGDGESRIASQERPATGPESPKGKTPKSAKGKKGGGKDVVIIPDEPREKFFCGCNAIAAVSQAACSSAALVRRIPLYQHVAALRCGDEPAEYRLPLPMVTMIYSGKAAPGKLNCVKEFMVIPKPGMPAAESVKHLRNIYYHCSKTLSVKTGVVGRAVNELGALITSFDRAEQGLDLLQEAITQQGLNPGEDFHLAINCAGHEMFDQDKGKYEVMSGMQKMPEDMADFWAELVGRYPSIIAIIDPMRRVEKEPWMKLCEKVSERCYVVGDFAHHRPGLLKDEELTDDFKTSGIVLRLEHMNSVSDILKVAKKMEDADNQIVIGTSPGETPDTFVADLAVGCGAKFLKLGAPCRGERVAKLNRLLQIEAELAAENKLANWGEHTFPLVKPPTPPPPPEEGAEGGEPGEGAPKEDKK